MGQNAHSANQILGFLNPLEWNHEKACFGCGWKGPVNKNLSILLSGIFLGISLLVFSENQHGVRGPCGVVCDKAGFLGKKIYDPKMGKMGQK